MTDVKPQWWIRKFSIATASAARDVAAEPEDGRTSMSEFGHFEGFGDFSHDAGAIGHETHSLGDLSHQPGLSISEDQSGVDAWQHLGASTETTNANEIGNPAEYQHDWFFQKYNGYCVPSSITQVIEAQSGEQIHDWHLVQQEANRLGLPNDGGYQLPQAQEIMQSFGVPCHVETFHAPVPAIEHLADYLHEGRNVILAVNASPIWYGSPDASNPGGHADHALVVTAINAQTGEVTLSDPGSPTGNEETVPLSTFMQAWSASDYGMLVTDHAAGTEDHQVQEDIAHAEHPGTSPQYLAPAADSTSPAVGHVGHVGHVAESVVLPIALSAGWLAGTGLRAWRSSR